MRTLYLPIFEPGPPAHDVAVKYKRGLYNAFARIGPICEWDYLANDADTRYQGMINRIELFAPTLVFTQLHAADVFTPAQIAELKAAYPGIVWVNWSGDSWAHSLTAPAILDLAREFDLWLVAAPDALPTYEREGIKAAYWNIAYEPPVEALPDMPAYDVVFLANVINDKRRALMERLRAIQQRDGIRVGIYGDWENSDGRNVYDFPAGEALYRNAKIAICDNVYEDQQNYISNRPMQAMAAAKDGMGAVVLHQHVPKMVELSGWERNEHYVEWADADHLDELLTDWLRPERAENRRYIAAQAQAHVLKWHTWEERVRVLVEELLPELVNAATA